LEFLCFTICLLIVDLIGDLTDFGLSGSERPKSVRSPMRSTMRRQIVKQRNSKK